MRRNTIVVREDEYGFAAYPAGGGFSASIGHGDSYEEAVERALAQIRAKAPDIVIVEFINVGQSRGRIAGFLYEWLPMLVMLAGAIVLWRSRAFWAQPIPIAASLIVWEFLRERQRLHASSALGMVFALPTIYLLRTRSIAGAAVVLLICSVSAGAGFIISRLTRRRDIRMILHSEKVTDDN